MLFCGSIESRPAKYPELQNNFGPWGLMGFQDVPGHFLWRLQPSCLSTAHSCRFSHGSQIYMGRGLRLPAAFSMQHEWTLWTHARVPSTKRHMLTGPVKLTTGRRPSHRPGRDSRWHLSVKHSYDLPLS